MLAAAAGPLALIGAGLMLYNALRFGNPLEFGEHYQLLAGGARGTQPMFSPRYLGFNLRAYLLQPFHLGSRFPFVTNGPPGPPPAGHGLVETPFGILAAVPLAWMALAAPLGCRNRDRKARAALGWCLAAAGLFVAVTVLTLGCYWWTASRYEVDFLPPLMLLAVLGILGAERALASGGLRRLAVRGAWMTLLVLSIAFNLLSSFEHRAEQYGAHGRTQAALGRLPAAIADFRRALEMNPDASDVRLDLAAAYEKTGANRDAIAALEERLRRAPGSADAEADLGFALVRLGRRDQAVAHFERALKLRGEEGGTPPVLDAAQAYEDGEMMLALGRLPGAIADFREALGMRPDYAEARLELAAAYERAGAMDAARTELTETLRRDAGSAEAENRLGFVLFGMGRAGEAISHFERALRLTPGLAEAENNLGLALVGAGRGQEAVRHFEAALRLRPDFAEAHENLGFALAREGRRTEAIPHVERALQLDPGNAYGHYVLGVLLGLQGDAREAATHLERALELRPGFPEARAALARLKARVDGNR
jgi:tetratricopeptide (TPR) repeat protein